jgi:hypothetical protein
MEKSANKRWKESGSTLSFKEWINRENEKKDGKNFLPFDSMSIQTDTANQISQSIKEDIYGLEDTPTIATSIDQSKVLGIDKSILILSGLLIAASLTYYLIKRAKANK